MDIIYLHTKTRILKHYHTDVKSIYAQEKYSSIQFAILAVALSR